MSLKIKLEYKNKYNNYYSNYYSCACVLYLTEIHSPARQDTASDRALPLAAAKLCNKLLAMSLALAAFLVVDCNSVLILIRTHTKDLT